MVVVPASEIGHGPLLRETLLSESPRVTDQRAREAEAEEQKEASRFEGDLRWLMNDVRGRRILWDRFLAPLYVLRRDPLARLRDRETTDPYQQARWRGQREFLEDVRDAIHAACPSQLALMIAENLNPHEQARDDS